MQDFIQKVNFKGGVGQITGTGSPEGVITGYVGQTYRDTANNNLYEKATGDNTNTGWALKTGAGGSTPIIDNLTSTSTTSALSANQGRILNEKSVTVEDNLNSTSTTNALSANQGRILNEKNNLVYSNYFNGASTQVLYTSSNMDIRWDGTNKQFQYYPKFPTTDWHDAGIMIIKGTSITSNTDDISAAQNQWFYFTTGGTLNPAFNLASYGTFAFMHVTPESFNSNYPAYRLVAGCGSANSVWVNIYKNN
jgi:hypothetical protein